MRTLILYTSKTGGTKKYAEQIALGMSTEAKPLTKKTLKKVNFDDYDTVVFGGWIMGSKIQGLDLFLTRWDDMAKKNVIVFGSGMSFVSKESRSNLIMANLLDLYHLRFYQLRGSFDYSKLKFPTNLFLKFGIAAAKRSQDAGTDVAFLESILEHPFEYNDEEGVNRILSVLHRLETEKAA